MGVFEGVLYADATPGELVGAVREKRIISFDSEDKVVRVFDWADPLPADGIPEVYGAHDREPGLN